MSRVSNVCARVMSNVMCLGMLFVQCVCLCMCACVHVYMCMFTCVCVCVYLCVCIYVRVYVVCTCKCMRACKCMCVLDVYLQAQVVYQMLLIFSPVDKHLKEPLESRSKYKRAT